MVSPEILRRVRDELFREFVLSGDTGFWGMGIGKDEIILYHDKSRATRRVNVSSTYVMDGEAVRVRIVEARTPRALTQRSA